LETTRSPRYPAHVRVVEVSPRDGLQNESGVVTTAQKVSLIEALVDAGVNTIECGSFVSPKWVPQMADSAAVFERIRRTPGVRYTALVPNLTGLSAAVESRVDEIAVFAAASETFSQKNINCSIAESLRRLREVASESLRQQIPVRGYVSCSLGCPYEGAVETEAVVRVAQALAEMGCYEISIGDTIGVGTPLETERLLEALSQRLPIKHLAVHFHNTRGQALANILVALQLGVSVVDASVAGLGGCPYAPGAAGNVATEELIYMLHGMQITTGIDLKKLTAAGQAISTALKRASAAS
jgi:hydroxymethylglutaryl-CoA lyase